MASDEELLHWLKCRLRAARRVLRQYNIPCPPVKLKLSWCPSWWAIAYVYVGGSTIHVSRSWLRRKWQPPREPIGVREVILHELAHVIARDPRVRRRFRLPRYHWRPSYGFGMQKHPEEIWCDALASEDERTLLALSKCLR